MFSNYSIMDIQSFLNKVRSLISLGELRETLTIINTLLRNCPHLNEVIGKDVKDDEILAQIHIGRLEVDNGHLSKKEATAKFLAFVQIIETLSEEHSDLRDELNNALSKDLKHILQYHTGTGDNVIGQKVVMDTLLREIYKELDKKTKG